jgi:hypothetical protein
MPTSLPSCTCGNSSATITEQEHRCPDRLSMQLEPPWQSTHAPTLTYECTGSVGSLLASASSCPGSTTCQAGITGSSPSASAFPDPARLNPRSTVSAAAAPAAVVLLESTRGCCSQKKVLVLLAAIASVTEGVSGTRWTLGVGAGSVLEGSMAGWGSTRKQLNCSAAPSCTGLDSAMTCWRQ